ncbi:MAG: hypothetical protein R3E77_10385 [Steroidobacteraceae bacterium]
MRKTRQEFRIDEMAGREFLSLESARLKECVAYYRRRGLRAVHISRFHGFAETDLGVLATLPQLEAVFVQDPWVDHGPLHDLPDLQWLTCGPGTAPLDVSRLPALRHLNVDWWPALTGLPSARKLRYLDIGYYKPPARDLSELAGLKGSLRELFIERSSIKSLNGVQALQRLHTVSISFCRALEDISALAPLNGSLRKLAFVNCRKVQPLPVVRSLKSLSRLALSGTAPIESLGFVRSLKSLRTLILTDTRIEDGNLRPALGVRDVRFTSSKGYSHDRLSFRAEQRRRGIRVPRY